MLAIALAAVAAGAIIAITGGGHGSASSVRARANGASAAAASEIVLAASYLGVTPTQLRKQMQSGRTLAQVANATGGKSAAGLLSALVSAKAGRLRTTAAAKKLTPKQEQTRLASLRTRIHAQINRLRADRVPGYIGLAATARYLGVSASQLRAQLLSGRSLAQIAAATPGKSASGLIDARVSAREVTLKAALASGEITRAHASVLCPSCARGSHTKSSAPPAVRTGATEPSATRRNRCRNACSDECKRKASLKARRWPSGRTRQCPRTHKGARSVDA